MTDSLIPASAEQAYNAYLDAKVARRFADDPEAAAQEVARRHAQWLTAIRLDVASRPVVSVPAERNPRIAGRRYSTDENGYCGELHAYVVRDAVTNQLITVPRKD